MVLMHWLRSAPQRILGWFVCLCGLLASYRSVDTQRAWSFETLEPRLPMAGVPGLVPVGEQPSGTLDGKIVYTSGGHGWQWNDNLGRWATDRGNLLSMVEDFGNQDQMSYYADYLLRAGATVVPMRPVGRQAIEVVLDNDSPGVTWSGSWSNNTVGPRWYDEDYGAATDAVKYRFATVNSTSETAVATYTPNIPAAGFYPVYAWASMGTNRTDQLYRIHHTGGETQLTIDHRQVGNGWVYLGTYHFDAGSSPSDGSVQISNLSSGGGSVVIADSIRFGNGMGDLPWGANGIGTGNVSGYPREDEDSLVWLWRGVGQGSSFSSPSAIIGTSNVSAPIRMAEQMNADSNPYGTSVYVGFHSNATTGNPDTAASRGAIGLISAADPTPNQSSLAASMGRQINEDMRALDGRFAHDWSTRTSNTLAGAFGEITNARAGGEFDATIVEVAFHDNTQDAELLRDPKVRDQLARSTYEATLEHLINFNGTTAQPANVTLPSPPRDVTAVSAAAGEVTVSWTAGPSSTGGFNGVYGGPASGFRVYASIDGYGFDGGTYVAGGSVSSLALDGFDASRPYYFKVVAENAGGQSLASEVLTALPTGGPQQLLIVNGYDRLDRSQNFKLPFLSSSATTDRVWTRFNNSRDYTIQVQQAIQTARPGVHVDSTSNEAVINGTINLANYDSVVWILGTESTADDTLNSTEQTLVGQFLAGGGNLLITGSEIGWDLDAKNNGRSFFRNTLGASYVADNANTYTITAASNSIFAGLADFNISDGSVFSSLDGQTYDVAFPDVLSPGTGAQAALMYSGGSGGVAAVQKAGTAGQGSLVMFGFPFETIVDPSLRSAVMDNVLEFFNLSPPALAESPRVIDVIVAASGWDAAAIDLVDGLGVGAGNGLGLSLVGSEQLSNLTWDAIDRIYVVFDRDVAGSFVEANVALVGTKVADYQSLTQISYGQAGALVGTIALSTPLSNDAMVLSLSEAIRDTHGTFLDGEWSDGVSLRSGDDSAGGQFNFRINSLPGDVDQSGGVNINDVLGVNAKRGIIPDDLIEARVDIDRNGGINITDLLLVNARRGTVLPAPPSPHNFGQTETSSFYVAADALVIEVPVAKVPVAEVPVAEVPVAEVPVAEVPVVEVPVAEVPVAEVPVAEVPVAEVPVAEVPVAEVPVAEVPVAEVPVAEVPGESLVTSADNSFPAESLVEFAPEIDERVCRSPSPAAHQQAMSELGYATPLLNSSDLKQRQLYWVESV
ncbi:MAG: N-acetylmuramoyl-L-alanine amidase [Pirellulaceae bacterium]|nr:N-acetylmuramoyl-L-alanine amidase [Pirellulaceae bacterium]